ncbi:MAG: hypothetical protein ABIJ57_09280 [Pseudomonadota bacterium]
MTQAIRQALKLGRVWHWKFRAGIGNPPGVPDIIGIYRVRVDELVKAGVDEVGLFLGIEVKAPGKFVKAGSDQDQFLQTIQVNRGIAFEANDVQAVIDRLKLEKRAMPLFKQGGTG